MKTFLLLITTVLLGLTTFTFAGNIDDAVQWMYENGLTIYDNTTDFHAERWLRRDEAAKFFVQFSQLLGKTTAIKTDTQCTFSDINNAWSDLKSIVFESCKLWLFQWNQWKFYPQDQLTNAQAITVLIRLIAGSQSEYSTNHRADKYYQKAYELNLLNEVDMDIRNAIATRWNVWLIIYAASLLDTDFDTRKLSIDEWAQNFINYANGTYDVSIKIQNSDINLPINGTMLNGQYTTFFKENTIDIACKSNDGETVAFTITPFNNIVAWSSVYAWWTITNTTDVHTITSWNTDQVMCHIIGNSWWASIKINDYKVF